jgi:hypothetical protein
MSIFHFAFIFPSYYRYSESLDLSSEGTTTKMELDIDVLIELFRRWRMFHYAYILPSLH